MSTEKERVEFIRAMFKEGMDGYTAKKILDQANIIQECAYLECSSEAADKDRVPCPNHDQAMKYCPKCDARADSAAAIQHYAVTRISIKSDEAEAEIRRLCSRGFEAVFSGDPRGACVKIKVPSGRTDDWGNTGICVPTDDF